MSFLVVKNLDDADQFILGRDFVWNFDVMIDLNNGLIRIRNPDRKYVKKPINRIITDENKVPIFLDRKVKLQPGQAVVAIFRMRNLNSLSDSKKVCLVPNPNSQSSVILGRRFSVTHLLDTNGKKIGVTGLLDTEAVVSVMPIKTWERMGFTREDLIPTNLRLAATNRGVIYVAGRTLITVLHMGDGIFFELPVGREFGRRRPVHLGQRFRLEF